MVTFLAITACNNKKDDGKKEVAAETATITTTPADDSAAIRKTIVDFYAWYSSNYKKLMAYDLYSSIKKNNGAPYKMNWDHVDKYMAFVRDSIPQLGDEFLVNQKKMFEKADSAFKKDVDGDVPYYFDYDWYTNSQEEPSYLLEGINKSRKWIISIKGDDASVEVGAPEDKNFVSGSLLLYVGLKKENGQWTIAKIGND